MSYLHCPTCSRAYNVTREAACPACGIRANAPRDPVDEIVQAAKELARAIERATTEQLLAARHALRGEIGLRALLAPPAAPKPAKPRLLERVMFGLRGLLAT